MDLRLSAALPKRATMEDMVKLIDGLVDDESLMVDEERLITLLDYIETVRREIRQHSRLD